MVHSKRLKRKTTELNDYSSVSKGGRVEAEMTQREQKSKLQEWRRREGRKYHINADQGGDTQAKARPSAVGGQAAERSTHMQEHRRLRVGRSAGCLHQRRGAAWTFVGTGEAGFARRGFEIKGTRGKQSG